MDLSLYTRQSDTKYLKEKELCFYPKNGIHRIFDYIVVRHVVDFCYVVTLNDSSGAHASKNSVLRKAASIFWSKHIHQACPFSYINIIINNSLLRVQQFLSFFSLFWIFQ